MEGNAWGWSLTYRAIVSQFDAMDSRAYDLAVLDHQQGRVFLRSGWTPKQVIGAVGWLRFENGRGRDVCIRPVVSALVLVDDLSPATVARLPSFGLEPALVVETSPANCQAWIRLGLHAQPPAVLKEVAAVLAVELGADRRCVALGHFGRLAGLTNRKPKHAHPRPPYARVVVASPGAVSARGGELVQAALARLAAKVPVGPARCQSEPVDVEVLPQPTRPWPMDATGHPITLADWVRTAHAEARARYRERYDPSIADFRIARDMVLCGVRVRDVRGALAEHSPGIAQRKAGHVTDYARRTAQQAFQGLARR